MPVKKWMIGIVILFVCLAFSLNMAFAKAKPIKLGALFVMSGKLGGYGKSGWQGIQLAVDEINAQGGILG